MLGNSAAKRIKLLCQKNTEFEQVGASEFGEEQGAEKTAPAPGPVADSNDQRVALSEDYRAEA